LEYIISIFHFVKGSFFGSGERHKFEKIEKTAFTNPTFFVFKIRILLGVICCENFGRFHRRKFKKITNKAIKTAKKHIDLGIYNLRIKHKILT